LKKKGVTTGVKCVFSVERTERELLPLKEHQKVDPDQFRLLPNYRVRIVPVFSAMPALMGQTISSYVLCDIAGQLYK
jgi:tRNA A37 threonylcarbamoyladenosine dehydratase